MGLGRGLAEALGADLGRQGPAAGDHNSSAGWDGLGTDDADDAATAGLWRPLDEWPLLPLSGWQTA